MAEYVADTVELNDAMAVVVAGPVAFAEPCAAGLGVELHSETSLPMIMVGGADIFAVAVGGPVVVVVLEWVEVKLTVSMDHFDGCATQTRAEHPQCHSTRRKYCN